ncbi:hypothetical protein Q6284_28965, partial [Klebsiella pneumoniae]|nr:hypothetical protein [Klebsiella pneumoniae]
KGIEVMRALRKGQASAFYYGDPLGETPHKPPWKSLPVALSPRQT